MGIDAWAAQTGERPKAVGKVEEWFAAHEDVRVEVREARARGWSWRQLTDYLTAEYAFPFRDSESVAKECQ